MRRICPHCERIKPDASTGPCDDCRRKRERERNATDPRRKLRNSKRWQEVRERVKARDGGACVECCATEPLEVHHKAKILFVRDPFDMYNLETLCVSCHRKKDRRVA
jgi:5-methylcytosine-specific restriction endonuclease McrA